jgi:hypothetical protein
MAYCMRYHSISELSGLVKIMTKTKPPLPWSITCKLACRAMITGENINELYAAALSNYNPKTEK